MHSALEVAGYLLKLAKDDDKTLTPMQLLKLVYLAHGWMLGLHGRPLIEDNIEAWKYGPVIPALYKQIKKFHSGPVGPDALQIATNLDDCEKNILAQVYRIYGGLTGIKLSMLTHEPESPWHQTITKDRINISNDIIQEYYSNMYDKSKQSN